MKSRLLLLPVGRERYGNDRVYVDDKHGLVVLCVEDAPQTPRYLVDYSSNVVPSIKELSERGHVAMFFWGGRKCEVP